MRTKSIYKIATEFENKLKEHNLYEDPTRWPCNKPGCDNTHSNGEDVECNECFGYSWPCRNIECNNTHIFGEGSTCYSCLQDEERKGYKCSCGCGCNRKHWNPTSSYCSYCRAGDCNGGQDFEDY